MQDRWFQTLHNLLNGKSDDKRNCCSTPVTASRRYTQINAAETKEKRRHSRSLCCICVIRVYPRLILLTDYPSRPRNFAELAAWPGKTAWRLVAPRCLPASSPNTSRKSVVKARSRPSYNWSLFKPGQSP